MLRKCDHIGNMGGLSPARHHCPRAVADPFVMDPHGRQRFERQFAASLPAFAFLSPCFEVGNELNLGDQLKAADYVERLLRPQYDVMRRIRQTPRWQPWDSAAWMPRGGKIRPCRGLEML